MQISILAIRSLTDAWTKNRDGKYVFDYKAPENAIYDVVVRIRHNDDDGIDYTKDKEYQYG